MKLKQEEKRVIKEVSSEYKLWAGTLSELELSVIQKYTKNSHDKEKPNRFFERLNRAMRGKYDGADKTKLLNYGKILSDAICKQPLSHQIICYRGVDEDLLLNTPIGSCFKFKQFISTSIVASRALKKEFKYVIVVPAGAKGAYIGNLSRYKQQYEFLLDVSCEYKLLDKRGNYVYLEVIV